MDYRHLATETEHYIGNLPHDPENRRKKLNLLTVKIYKPGPQTSTSGVIMAWIPLAPSSCPLVCREKRQKRRITFIPVDLYFLDYQNIKHRKNRNKT